MKSETKGNALMKTQESLKPCPCCGASAEYIEDLWGEGYLTGIACTQCSMAAVAQAHGKNLKEELILDWNRRST